MRTPSLAETRDNRNPFAFLGECILVSLIQMIIFMYNFAIPLAVLRYRGFYAGVLWAWHRRFGARGVFLPPFGTLGGVDGWVYPCLVLTSCRRARLSNGFGCIIGLGKLTIRPIHYDALGLLSACLRTVPRDYLQYCTPFPRAQAPLFVSLFPIHFAPRGLASFLFYSSHHLVNFDWR